MDRPEYLFRFRPFNQAFAVGELEHALGGEIFMPVAHTANDPFDFRPAVRIPSPGEVLKFLKKGYGHRPTIDRNRMAELKGRPISREEYRRFKRDFVPSYASAEVERKSFLQIMESTPSRYCLACFSERFSSPLMWAHYAANQAGICLRYRFIPDRAQDTSMMPFMVMYSENRPSISFEQLNGLAGRGRVPMSQEVQWEVLQALFHVKGRDWAYEKEWRIVTHIGEGTGYRASPHLLFEGVIFGLRTSAEDKRRVRDVLQGRYPVFSAVPDEDTFDLALAGDP